MTWRERAAIQRLKWAEARRSGPDVGGIAILLIYVGLVWGWVSMGMPLGWREFVIAAFMYQNWRLRRLRVAVEDLELKTERSQSVTGSPS